MGREQKRRLDARKAKQLVQSGQAQRRPMTDSEAELLFLAIDRAEVQQVGITRLASLELNNLHRAPWCFGGSSLSTTLLDFAAWRGRDIFSCQLIAAGADPSEGVVSPNVWEKLPRAYVAWLARAAARLRRQLSASSVCVCGKMPSMLFLPCGHANCASCIWRQFESFHFGPLPELICAQCNATFDDPSMTFLAQRRGIIRRDPTSKSESNQICAGCGCLNIARAVLCINCGWTLSQPRFTTAPKASPPPSCFDWLIQQMIGKKSRYSVRERQERKLQSLQRWKELPEEMQDSKDSKDPAANDSNDPSALRPLSPPPFAPNARRVTFRALSPQEVACDKLGLSRPTRSERLRVAAEVGDVRHLAALLEAGADVETVNEYGQSPLFLAAMEGHLEAVQELLDWGADATLACHGGATAYEAGGCHAVRRCLAKETRWNCLPLRKFQGPRFLRYPPKAAVVELPLHDDLKSLGACYVDGAFNEPFLKWLEELWQTLPQAPFSEADSPPEDRHSFHTDRSRQATAPRRSYFFDATKIVSKQLYLALAAHDGPKLCTCEEAVPKMRFLHYKEGGYLAPHTDLCRCDWKTDKRTTHTFILYLRDPTRTDTDNADTGGAGGETVLMHTLKGQDLVKVTPKRGRLLVFPHLCPHKGLPVKQTKLLLRGEMQ